MGRHKLKKFAEIEEMENVFSKPEYLKGKWRKKVFKNDSEIVVELGCAHGDYARALAEKFPKKNFIGIDRKSDRLWSASKKTSSKSRGSTEFGESKTGKVVFCWCDGENLEAYFANGEINELWITFPDPYPKPSKANRRLISPRFLSIYKKVVKRGGIVHFKTDNETLFDYAVELLQNEKVSNLEIIKDVHAMKKVPELLQIKTFYEKRFISEGKPIFYLRFTI